MDISWLATEAKTIHLIFSNTFYSLVLVLLVVGVLLDYFKLPLGGAPQFHILLGRALIACLLLSALPEIMNFIADFSDQLSKQIGDINNFKLVLHRMGDKFDELSWSWVSVKQSLLMALSFLSFFLLYLTIYFMDAVYIYTWVLLYIFSPVLIALFVLPATAGLTTGLFKSLIEVASWKIVWSVLAAILWSMALSDINKPEHNIDLLTAIVLNLMLAFSVLYTPKITSAFYAGGLAGAASFMGDALTGGIYPSPSQVTSQAKSVTTGAVSSVGTGVSSKFSSMTDEIRRANGVTTSNRSKQKPK